MSGPVGISFEAAEGTATVRSLHCRLFDRKVEAVCLVKPRDGGRARERVYIAAPIWEMRGMIPFVEYHRA